jgi:hypothetical protein
MVYSQKIMFCPKCAAQNADETKFCRACGADISSVLAVVDGLPTPRQARSEKYIDLYSSGIRNLMLALGFLFISMEVYRIPPTDTYIWLLLMIPAFPLVASGVSRLLKAKGLKALSQSEASQPMSLPGSISDAFLPSAQGEFIKPEASVYETDDLLEVPSSVTEHTTRRLKSGE